jgi:hypothetical protein
MQMSRDDIVPIGVRFVHDAAAKRHVPGIVDENINNTQLGFYGSEGWEKIIAPGKIHCRCHTRDTNAPKLLKRGSVLGFGSPQNGDSCARSGESKSDSATETTVTPGYDSHFAVQIKQLAIRNEESSFVRCGRSVSRPHKCFETELDASTSIDREQEATDLKYCGAEERPQSRANTAKWFCTFVGSAVCGGPR